MRKTDIYSVVLMDLVVFLHRVEEGGLELLCPLLLYVETEVPEKEFAFSSVSALE